MKASKTARILMLSIAACLLVGISGLRLSFSAEAQSKPEKLADSSLSNTSPNYLDLPDFKLPYASGQNIRWTGGPHAYNAPDFGSTIPAGQGSGLDFNNGQSFEVLAMASGNVVYVSNTDCDKSGYGFGCQVAIQHDIGGSVIVYAHLNKDSLVKIREKFELDKQQGVNSWVPQGTVIARAGDTGQQSNVHLHVELRTGEKDADGSWICSTRCLPDKLAGNPLGWDQLLELHTLDTWYISGYCVPDADHECLKIYNYDGSAFRLANNATFKVLYTGFRYNDNGQLTTPDMVRVGTLFSCKYPNDINKDCELPENQDNPDNLTQFARDDGKGAVFSMQNIIGGKGLALLGDVEDLLYKQASFNYAGELTSSNIPSYIFGETTTPTPYATNPPLASNGIQLCRGQSYSTPCQSYVYNTNDTCINLAQTGMDNLVQSVRFLGNYIQSYEVIMFGDNNCTVYEARFGSDASTLGGLNNQISSIRMEKLQPADCTTSPDGVTLYVNAGYQGHCHTFTPGSYPDLGQFQLDQNITSIKNPGGAFAIHFNDGLNFSSTPGHFDGDVYDLGPNGWSDRARSVQIERHIPTTCNPVSDGAALYVDTNYGSGCISVPPDIPDLSKYTLDHALDSLRFFGSYKNTSQVLIYRQKDYVDLCKAYWQDQSDLRECAGQAVSVKIIPFTPPTPIPTLPGTLFSGNIAPNAYLYPGGTGAVVDGNLSTEWPGDNNGSTVYFSWSTPVTIHRVVVWDRAPTSAANGINSVALTFSDGTIATNIDMTVAGPRCADIYFPDKTVNWVGVMPWDGAASAGFSEIEVWATTGQQYSDNTCVMVRNVTPVSSDVSAPPIVATPTSNSTQTPISDLVVSTNPLESSDGQAHDASHPYLIPLNAQYNSVNIKSGAYASASAWNGMSGGTVSFKVNGPVVIDGVFTVDGKGYRGGPAVIGANGGHQGESFTGYGTNTFGPNGGGGGGGFNADSGGGGGGYGAGGQNAQNGPDVGVSYGGGTYGDPTLSNLYLGSGGGSSGAQSTNFGGAGGPGGGAIFIQADSITINGSVSANGANGKSAGTPSNPRGGGGGSGGSILLRANTITINGQVTSLGGWGGYGIRDGGYPASGGNGSTGRIRLEYTQNYPTGSTNPPASIARYVSTQDLVISTNAAESSDAQAHGSSNPYVIPLDAHFHSVTIKPGAYATTSAWNGNSGGMVRFSVSGTIQIDGVLTVNGSGYRGGPSVTGASNGKQGESYSGWSQGDVTHANGGGGGGGAGADSGGGGGGYGTPGQNAVNGADISVAYGGNVYGDSALTVLYLGSGGGSSGAQSANVGGAGGNGGGAVFIEANQIIVSSTGSITANGANGTSAGAPTNPRGGGGGSGGSIFLSANIITLNGPVTSLGGAGGYGIREDGRPAAGGAGGVGRIYIEYGESPSGLSFTNPAAIVHLNPALQPTPTYTPSPTITPTPTATASPTSTPTMTPTALPTATPTETCNVTTTTWLGEYWNNTTLSGAPIKCRYYDDISFEWYSGSPVQGVASDHFSARWTKIVNFDAGTYRFTLFHDDGARLYMDNNLIIDNWCDTCRVTNTSNSVSLSSGNHTVKLELHENLGWASVRLSWNKPNVDVAVRGIKQDSYFLAPGSSLRASFLGLNNGPVGITNTTGASLIGAERVIYKVNGVNTSFTEMMALPNSQLTNLYWLPWYNNVDLDTQLRFGNVSGSTAHVHIIIAGHEMTGSPFTLLTGQSTRVSFGGMNNGPVKIQSDQNIVAAERVVYKANGLNTSFAEMMALPNSQLNTTYWLPWYNNTELDTQLRIGNVSGTATTIHIFIGGMEVTPVNGLSLGAGASTRLSFPGVNKGPVKIQSNQNIVAAERVVYKVNGINTSFTEVMALPNSQLTATYWLPWYNNADLDTQLRIGNVSGSTATIHIFIGGTEVTPVSGLNLSAGASTRLSYPGMNNGPVKIESDQNIVAAERVIYKVNNLNTSFSEMMGLPDSQLNSTYWLPWYNNVDLDTQLRFGVP